MTANADCIFVVEVGGVNIYRTYIGLGLDVEAWVGNLLQQTLRKLHEDKHLVFGKVWVPLLDLLRSESLRSTILARLEIAAMLGDVGLEQEVDLLTVPLWVVMGIVRWRLKDAGASLLTLVPELRAKLKDALLTWKSWVGTKLLVAVGEGLWKTFLSQLAHFVELVVLQQDFQLP